MIRSSIATSAAAALATALVSLPTALPAQGEARAVQAVRLENDRVRVVELTYAPGAVAARHTHHFPRAVYVLEGGTLELTPDAGEPRRLEVAKGQTVWQPAETHTVRNVGTTTVRVLETEVRGPTAELSTWPIHSMERPRPPVVDPGPAPPPAPVPSDAVVLFGGRDLSAWEVQEGGGPAPWRIEHGELVVVPESGSIRTRQGFGDVQLHLEWASPSPPEGDGQDRGNSGVFLMGRYEVQVLDSYGNVTYADGQAAALYGQRPPEVNVSRPPGVWQTYDIVFHRPRFDASGTVLQPARITVFHNGVLVQDHAPFAGPTRHQQATAYEPHGDRLPIVLQDHGVPVRYRNIWVRELGGR